MNPKGVGTVGGSEFIEQVTEGLSGVFRRDKGVFLDV